MANDCCLFLSIPVPEYFPQKCALCIFYLVVFITKNFSVGGEQTISTVSLIFLKI